MSHGDLIWSPFYSDLTNSITQKQDLWIRATFVTCLVAIQADKAVTDIALSPGLLGVTFGILTSILSSEFLVATSALFSLIAAKTFPFNQFALLCQNVWLIVFKVHQISGDFHLKIVERHPVGVAVKNPSVDQCGLRH